jgi:hypothetical protein
LRDSSPDRDTVPGHASKRRHRSSGTADRLLSETRGALSVATAVE